MKVYNRTEWLGVFILMLDENNNFQNVTVIWKIVCNVTITYVQFVFITCFTLVKLRHKVLHSDNIRLIK